MRPQELTRGTINVYVRFIRSMFRWAVSEGLIPETNHRALECVTGLMHHQYAKEKGKRRPAPIADVYAVAEHVAKPVWGLIRLQLACGARGGELIRLRAVDIDTGGTVWIAKPTHHKTAWRGDDRVIHFGPRAQEILKEFIGGRPVDAFLFDPREGNAERQAVRATKGKPRRPGQKPNRRKTIRTIGGRYTPDSYRRAIERGCELADVPTWTPHQLRHNYATAIRKSHGAEAVGLMIGDKDTKMIDVYGERDQERALEIASEVG